MLQFRCPGCNAVLTADDDRAGKEGKCPKCGLQIIAPSGNESAAAGDASTFRSTFVPPQVRRTSGLAITSLVLSLCGIPGIFCFGIVLGPLAVIFGAVALSQISSDPRLGGRGMAVAGLVIGIIEIVASLFFLFAWFVGRYRCLD